MDKNVKDKIMAADQYRNEKEYWDNKLSGELPKTCFPQDNPTVSKGKIEWECVNFQLPEPLSERLLLIANKSDSRLHIILAAGILLLAFKYNNSHDLIIGTPIDKQETEGEFLNTILPLRVKVDEQMTVKNFLTVVKQTVFEASENQNYPIEIIPHELELTTEDEFSLFDIAMLLENIQDEKYLQQVNIDILFSFLRTQNSLLDGTIKYNAVIFKKETILRILGHLTYLLEGAFFNVDLKLIDVPVLTEKEKKQVIFDFNNTSQDYPADKSVYRLFEEQVAKSPEKIAVEFKDERLSYANLNEKANQLARYLKRKGLGEPGAVTAILLDSSLEVPIAILAVLKAGGTYLPLGLEYPEARINFILQDSMAQLILTRESLKQENNFLVPCLYLEDTALFTGDGNNMPANGSEGNLAYIIYTSGTTGQSKGVMIEQRGLTNYTWWAARTYVRDETLGFALYTSIAFDLTVTSIFTPLVTGNPIIVHRGPDIGFFTEELINDNRIGIVKLTPSHLQLLRDKKMAPSSIKRIIVGGDKLEAGLAQVIYQNFEGNVEIYNEYGPTETTVGSMIYKFAPGDRHNDSVPIGAPIANTRIYLLNRYLQPIPIGVEGELYIAGDGVARGYLHNQGLTETQFVPDPFFPGQKMYKSGDIAFRLADNNIKYKGRIDHQVKIRGFRVDLSEIEEKISLYEGVNEVAVVVRQEDDDKNLCAFFTAGGAIDIVTIKAHLNENLPAYMVPGFMMQLKKMPLNINGKIDRTALQKIEIFGDHDNYIPPETEVQLRLAGIWSEVLGIDKEKVGIHTNFFEMGGHSLKVMSLVAKIHKEFNVKVSLVQVFNSPTLGGLASYIDENKVQDTYIAISPQELKEYYLLSSAQRRFYLAQHVKGVDTAYNMTGIIDLPPDFNEQELTGIFQTLIKRHESLRTSFRIINNEPVQIIHPHVDLDITHRDVEEEQLKDSVASFVMPFRLDCPPLFRVAILRTPRTKILAIDIHHIISDGLSLQILTREFNSLEKGRQLPLLTVHYKDYAVWQQYLLQQDSYKNMEHYWLQALENFIVTELPVDNQGNDCRKIGSYESTVIQNQDYLEIENFCFKYKVTFFSFMFSIFSFILARETGIDDIVLGTPVDNRVHSDLENVIGVFLNVFLLRAIIDKNDSIINNIININTNVVNALENNAYPYEELYYKLKERYRLPNDELFSILFNYLPDDNGAGSLPGSSQALGMSAIDIKPKYPLTVYINDTGKKLILNLVYRSDMYSPERIRRILHNYIKFIELAVTGENCIISKLTYEDEKKNEPVAGIGEGFDTDDLF